MQKKPQIKIVKKPEAKKSSNNVKSILAGMEESAASKNPHWYKPSDEQQKK